MDAVTSRFIRRLLTDAVHGEGAPLMPHHDARAKLDQLIADADAGKLSDRDSRLLSDVSLEVLDQMPRRGRA